MSGHAGSGTIDVTSQMFGAKGDGFLNSDGTLTMGTDNTEAVQNAIDYAVTTDKRTIYFPLVFFVLLRRRLRLILDLVI